MTTPHITSARITRYDAVVVEVTPYVVDLGDGRRVVVHEFLGDYGDRGDYLVGRGVQLRKDGSVGVRRLNLNSGRTPANVRAAARALFD